MSNSDRQYFLPGKVDSYLAVLNRRYEDSGEKLLREVVVNGTVSIQEGTDSDNWNGGMYGHAITLTLSEELYTRIMDTKDQLQDRIRTDINKLDSSGNEYISEVIFDLLPAHDDDWRERTGVYRAPTNIPSIAPDALQRIWGEGRIRVFLSHKSSIKQDTAKLKAAFARCGVAAFVAHEDIEPTQEWQQEIERALFSMDALVALLSRDFHDSHWTDQEVGVAIGRGVPVIAVRLGMDPYGLMGMRQGLSRCNLEDPDGIASAVFYLLYKRFSDNSRLFECALSAYAASRSFDDSAWKIERLLSKFESLTSDQVGRVVDAYRTNAQNKFSFKGIDLLKPLLEKWTGKKWKVEENVLVLAEQTEAMDNPF